MSSILHSQCDGPFWRGTLYYSTSRTSYAGKLQLRRIGPDRRISSNGALSIPALLPLSVVYRADGSVQSTGRGEEAKQSA